MVGSYFHVLHGGVGMTDRNLLELAAKAAGIEYDGIAAKDTYSGHYVIPWNPLSDDGDALRLAAKLRILIDNCEINYPINNTYYTLPFTYGMDAYAATRRAIVRAAAEIGKELE
jgi:hypothetical protein